MAHDTSQSAERARVPGAPADGRGLRRTPFGGKRRLYNVVRVQFASTFIKHEYDAQLLELRVGDQVIVETSKGPAMAKVTSFAFRKVVPFGSLKRVLRVATRDDERRHIQNQRRQDEAFQFALERIRARGLPMKLIQVQLMHDGSKAIFYFSAEGRIDFRQLVRDLASRFRTRIEMRQIGVRDSARMIGGIGSCGRELCCSTFLENFSPVSIRMAKDQGLTLNPRKVSGVCGRLMCCLVYEQQVYRRARRRLPRAGKTVQTAQGLGTILEVDVLRERATVRLQEDDQRVALPLRELIVLTRRQLEALKEGHPPPGPSPRKQATPANPSDRLRSVLTEAGGADEAYLWDDPPASKDETSGDDRGDSRSSKRDGSKRGSRRGSRGRGRSRNSKGGRDAKPASGKGRGGAHSEKHRDPAPSETQAQAAEASSSASKPPSASSDGAAQGAKDGGGERRGRRRGRRGRRRGGSGGSSGGGGKGKSRDGGKPRKRGGKPSGPAGDT